MPHTLYIVSGMHRSGTSLATKMMEVFGVSLPGDLIGPAEDNAKGFFEDRAFVDINQRLLDELGLHWDSLHGFFLETSGFSSAEFDQLKDEARAFLQSRMTLDVPWAVKDPRFSRLTAFWLPLMEEQDIPCRVIVSLRDPAEVCGSLEKRNQFAELKSLYLWLFHNLDVLWGCRELAPVIVDYGALMSEPEVVLEQLAEFFPEADVAIRGEFVESFIEQGMHHHQGKALDSGLDLVGELYRAMQARDLSTARLGEFCRVLLEDRRLMELLEYVSTREILDRRAFGEREASLTAALEQREGAIEGFRAFQDQLERNLKELASNNNLLQAELDRKEVWSSKLEGDIEELSHNARQLTSSLEEANGEVARRGEQISSLEADIQVLQADIQVLQADLRTQLETNRQLDDAVSAERQALYEARQASEEEQRRLWEIIELYRVNLETIENSHSWRVTAPLRATRRIVQRAPAFLFGRTKAVLRGLVYLLPVDSMVRQWIVKVYERSVMLTHGELDNRSIVASLRSIIGNRQKLLGAPGSNEPAELPDLDISIVTYNSGKWVSGFRQSLLDQDYPLQRLHLVFVDNDSTDDTPELLEAQDWSAFGSFTLIRNENVGFGGGHNRGIGSGHSEFVLVTNIDLEFRAQSLVQAVRFAQGDEQDVATWELRQAPYEHPKFYDPVSLQTAWSAHACVLMRREAVEAVAGYEERIFMYGEDVELSYRFRAAGYKLRYLPAAVVNHYTYEEPGEIKRLQFQGSTLANAYIRMRYGSVLDVLSIIPMYMRLLLAPAPLPGKNAIVRGNIGKILSNARYFLSHRSPEPGFSFRLWDYDILREGAFYEAKPLDGNLPLVSVITRTYPGREQLLKECLQSVAHQSYPNVEHLVVEDGGDSMVEVIETFLAAYPDATVRHVPIDKLGRCAAGNRGLAEANGDYLVFLDDDDLFFSDHIEICVAELLADDELSAVYALAWEVETEFTDSGYEEKSHGTPDIHRQPFDRDVLMEHNYIPIQSIVFSRELYERHGGFDPELDNLEDWNLWVRYASDSNFRYVARTTSMYRTPWDPEERSRRQIVLDNYLPVARAKNAEVCR